MYFSTCADLFLRELPIRQKTLATYISMYKCHIHAGLGPKKIESIKRSDVQQVIKPLSPQTAAMSLAVIKTIFREGVSRGLVDESPADGVKTPSFQVVPRKFMTINELERADFGRYKPQILFMAYHGLRWGEAVALTDADIRDGRVYVDKSIHGQTKTKAGVRSVPLMCPYFPLPKSPKTLRRVCHENGIHIHSLRHSYAYLLKTSGVHVTTAQQLLGHSDPKVTLGVYTGFRESEIDEARKLMQEYLSR